MQDRLGVRPHVIQIKLPQENIIKYGLRLGDEMILAPLALFKPEAFGLQGPQLSRTQLRGESDPEDPYDQDYLRRTSRQSQGVKNYEVFEGRLLVLVIAQTHGLNPQLVSAESAV